MLGMKVPGRESVGSVGSECVGVCGGVERAQPRVHRFPLCMVAPSRPCRHGSEATNELFHNMQNLIIRCLLAVQPAMINDKHCFELYGWGDMRMHLFMHACILAYAIHATSSYVRASVLQMAIHLAPSHAPRSHLPHSLPHSMPLGVCRYDILIDKDLKPWIVEVNASPSLSASDKGDWVLKCAMLEVRAVVEGE
jgi:hypothetical protein